MPKPANPFVNPSDHDTLAEDAGITLRDYVAVRMLQSFYARETGPRSADQAVDYAFSIADAFLAGRE